MFELAARIVFATALMVVSGMLGVPPFDTAWRVAAFFATYSFLAFAMEKRGVRNAGVSGLFAVGDAAALAVVLASAGKLEVFGFLVLVPAAWAAFRFLADPLAMSPLVAAVLLVCANLFGGKGWTPVLLSQVVGVLAIGVLGARRERIVKVTQLVQVPGEAAVQQVAPDDFIELRENYRTLKEHATELERKGRRDRWVAQISEVVEGDPEQSLNSLARKLCELCGVSGLTLYAVSQTGDKLVVQGFAGDVPNESREAAFDLGNFAGEWQIKERVSSALNAIKTPEEAAHSGSVVLKDRGRIVGMLALFDNSRTKVADAVERAKECGETLAKYLRTLQLRLAEKRRTRQAELLYEISAATQGVADRASLARRVARELSELTKVDHVSVVYIEGGEPAIAAQIGPAYPVIENLNVDEAKGLHGWVESGSPEVVMFDARNDDRFPREVALKQRIGSAIVEPVQFSIETYGYILVGTGRVHGMDAETLETVRLVAAEFSQALSRLVLDQTESSGLATPTEFHELVRAGTQGILVYLEVLRREEMSDAYGRPALEHAARKLASRLRTLLPAGALMCRRAEGDFVVLLRTDDAEFAASWANNAAATASLMAVTSPDGTGRIPMAVRAKVAIFSQQSNQISKAASA